MLQRDYILELIARFTLNTVKDFTLSFSVVNRHIVFDFILCNFIRKRHSFFKRF